MAAQTIEYSAVGGYAAFSVAFRTQPPSTTHILHTIAPGLFIHGRVGVTRWDKEFLQAKEWGNEDSGTIHFVD